MKIPAHKLVGDAGKPGQISFDRYPYLKHSTAAPQDEQTLNEYIARKSDDLNCVPKPLHPVVKLTFEEWVKDHEQYYNQVEYSCLRTGWFACLKHGKVS